MLKIILFSSGIIEERDNTVYIKGKKIIKKTKAKFKLKIKINKKKKKGSF